MNKSKIRIFKNDYYKNPFRPFHYSLQNNIEWITVCQSSEFYILFF